MEKSNTAEEAIKHYLYVDDWYFKQYPEKEKFLLDSISPLQRYIDENNFVLDDYMYNNGREWIYYNYSNSDTHAVLIVINRDEINIMHSCYYGDLFIHIKEAGISGSLGDMENTCFRIYNDKICDYTLKYEYVFESDDVAGKISELISYAKNYYPKAFKAKCAKQRERYISERLHSEYGIG